MHAHMPVCTYNHTYVPTHEVFVFIKKSDYSSHVLSFPGFRFRIMLLTPWSGFGSLPSLSHLWNSLSSTALPNKDFRIGSDLLWLCALCWKTSCFFFTSLTAMCLSELLHLLGLVLAGPTSRNSSMSRLSSLYEASSQTAP